MSFASTIAAALRVADKVAGITVRYRRGAEEIEIENVRQGRTRAETADAQGTVIRGHVQDFLIEAAKLVLTSSEHPRPEEGDLILETRGDQTLVYEVRPVGGQKAWDWHDPMGGRQWFRIHTQHLSTENAVN